MMNEWPDVLFNHSFTMHEIFEQHQGIFPFWIRPYVTRHAVLRVTKRHRYSYGVTIHDVSTGRVMGRSIVREDYQKGWVPVAAEKISTVFNI
jgi:hypothetical protein